MATVDVFLQTETVRDSHHKNGNSQVLRDGVSALLDGGYVVCVGEGKIDQTFTKSADFQKWFDDMKPKTV